MKMFLWGPKVPTSSGGAGFSLFELLAVMAVMVVMVGLAVPSLDLGAPEDEVSTAIRKITGAVAEARYTAMLTGERQVLEFGTGKTLSISPGDGTETADMPKGVEVSLLETDEESCVPGEDCGVHFFPSGLAEETVLVLAYEAGSQKVRIDSVERQVQLVNLD